MFFGSLSQVLPLALQFDLYLLLRWGRHQFSELSEAGRDVDEGVLVLALRYLLEQLAHLPDVPVRDERRWLKRLPRLL